MLSKSNIESYSEKGMEGLQRAKKKGVELTNCAWEWVGIYKRMDKLLGNNKMKGQSQRHTKIAGQKLFQKKERPHTKKINTFWHSK